MLCTYLKEATRADHLRIERHPRLERLLAPDYTRNEYVHLLTDLHSFYATVEDPLFAALPEVPAVPNRNARRKTALLVQDLDYLTGRLPDLDVLPQPAPLSFPTTAHALGTLYVLEGATLGGRVIARHLKRSLQVQSGQGASFYTSYGPMLGTRWTSLVQYLNAFGSAHPDAWAPMQRAAAATFHHLNQWLTVQTSVPSTT